MDPTERDLAGLDAERPLAPAFLARLEAALLHEAATGRAAEGMVDPTGALLAGLDADRPLPPDTRHALEQALLHASHRNRWQVPVRWMAAAAAVLLVLASVAALRNGSARDDNVASGPAPKASRVASDVPVTEVPTTIAAAAGAGALSQTAAPATTRCPQGCPVQGGADRAGGTATAAAPSAAASAAARGPYVASVEPSSGPMSGGTTVTLRGAGFTGAGGVLFGSASALSFTIVSDSEIRAVSPPSAQPGTVVVSATFPDGRTTAAGPDDHFSYVAPGA